MFIAMNRFRVIAGSEAEFEKVWTGRDTHLQAVSGFVEFHLLRGPARADHVLYASHTIWRSRDREYEDLGEPPLLASPPRSAFWRPVVVQFWRTPNNRLRTAVTGKSVIIHRRQLRITLLEQRLGRVVLATVSKDLGVAAEHHPGELSPGTRLPRRPFSS